MEALQNKLDTLTQQEKANGHDPPSDVFYVHLREFLVNQNQKMKLKLNKHQIEDAAKRCANEFSERNRESIYHKIMSIVLSLSEDEDLTVERLSLLEGQPPSFGSMLSIDYLQSRLDYIEDYLANFH
jgi:hypothetical protein